LVFHGLCCYGWFYIRDNLYTVVECSLFARLDVGL